MAFRTIGELRQELIKEGIRWTPDPKPDSTLISRPSLGGGDLSYLPKAETLPRVDVSALIKASPTTNTHLLAHHIDRGFLPPSALKFGGTHAAQTVGDTEGSGVTAKKRIDWRNGPGGWNYITRIRN